jgi:hypothetical protein
MVADQLYHLPCSIAQNILGTELRITESARLQVAAINCRRYFIHFDETGRPLIKDQLTHLAQLLFMPAVALSTIRSEADHLDISFLGVEEEAGRSRYKLYFGFVTLLEPQTDNKAISIEWFPHDTTFSLKEYNREGSIGEQEARGKVMESLFIAEGDAKATAKTEQLCQLCFEILDQTNYSRNFLSVKEKDSQKRAVYFSLVEGAPLLFSSVINTLHEIARVLDIPEEAFIEWANTLHNDAVLEHIAIGTNNQQKPFITLYKNPSEKESRSFLIPSEVHKQLFKPNSLTMNFKSMESKDSQFNSLLEETSATELVQEYPAHIQPSDCACEDKANDQIVFALGSIGYDFISESVKHSLVAELGEAINNPEYFLQVLGAKMTNSSANPSPKETTALPNPNQIESQLHYAESVTWILTLDGTPLYAIKPTGPFASETYVVLRNFIAYHIETEKKHGSFGFNSLVKCTLAGKINGKIRLMNGIEVPVVIPTHRGLFCWTVDHLLTELLGSAPAKNAGAEKLEQFENQKQGVINFLERVYFALRNIGLSPKDRAINYAATNAFLVGQIFKKALHEKLSLRSIDAVRSPFGRPGSDSWDVVLTFFNPLKQLEQAKTVFRFTVDVSTSIPVLAGPVRTWVE